MDTELFAALFRENHITQAEFELIKLQRAKPVSVHWDLRVILYLGIVLSTTAVGILVYENMDTIGHQALLISIAIICLACFGYCFKYSKGYLAIKVPPPNAWFDYILLLGCLLLLTFIAYIQFQYNFFGNLWGLALFLPMIVLFITAYYFDHLGVLSLAITNLAAWAGISVRPTKILSDNHFNDSSLIYTGLVLAMLLIGISFMSQHKNIKAHFAFTYKNFGAHILFISLLALMFYFENYYFLLFVLLALTCFLFLKSALREKSFYFVVVSLLYAYTGLSYVVIRLLSGTGSDLSGVYLIIIYFIVSGIGLIRLFIHYNKILSKSAGIQNK